MGSIMIHKVIQDLLGSTSPQKDRSGSDSKQCGNDLQILTMAVTLARLRTDTQTDKQTDKQTG